MLHCNERVLELFGCSRNELIGQQPTKFSPDAQADGINSVEAAKNVYNSISDTTPFVFEWIHKRLDGEEFFTEVSITNFELKTGKYQLAIIRDITARKKAEEEKKAT